MCFPADSLSAALSKSDELFGIYPLLVYPCRVVDRGGMVRVPPTANNDCGTEGMKSAMNLNLGALQMMSLFHFTSKPEHLTPRYGCNTMTGIYGVPEQLRLASEEDEAAGHERPAAELFPTVTKVRELEAWVRTVGGFQHTYCDSFQVRPNNSPMHSLSAREA